jgi:hypothetical protein
VVDDADEVGVAVVEVAVVIARAMYSSTVSASCPFHAGRPPSNKLMAPRLLYQLPPTPFPSKTASASPLNPNPAKRELAAAEAGSQSAGEMHWNPSMVEEVSHEDCFHSNVVEPS